VLAGFVLGRHKDEVFLQRKGLLAPFGITKYYTDYWGAYTRHLEADAHHPGKRNTQHIERKHLTLRTRIKRLVRKTICFSRSTQMHDIVIGLFVNRYEFGLLVLNRKVQICNMTPHPSLRVGLIPLCSVRFPVGHL